MAFIKKFRNGKPIDSNQSQIPQPVESPNIPPQPIVIEPIAAPPIQVPLKSSPPKAPRQVTSPKRGGCGCVKK